MKIIDSEMLKLCDDAIALDECAEVSSLLERKVTETLFYCLIDDYDCLVIH
jgi:hypothetical protein